MLIRKRFNLRHDDEIELSLNIHANFEFLWFVNIFWSNCPYLPAFTPNQINREDVPNTRVCVAGLLAESARYKLSQNTCRNDAVHIWNKTPSVVKECSDKKAIKSFVTTLPIKKI